MSAANQCDGCRRGLPLKDGLHRAPDGSYDFIGCTRKLYECETCGAPLYTAETTGERACSNVSCSTVAYSEACSEYAEGRRSLVNLAMAGQVRDESNCSCDQRGRNVSCPRCRP